MATELAKAYVQIIPSAQGITGKISEAISGECKSAGEKGGEAVSESLASKLKSTVKKAIGSINFGEILSSAITEGANLEQSIGGIETLFKESADTMKQYAAEAYQTAGISANDYMEQSTSFAASLLSSLGGDTAAAADAANQAIIDMADNSNKMGTSLQDIQNAYQGFAKQNYTMLDNLKLGYGGTKTEMERLLADAQELSGVEYNIDNLDDVYEAIHVIQEDLDITGTTAEEAATTFSGSFASMKAAAQNFIGNLALGDDVTDELQALVDTSEAFLRDNAIPMIGNIFATLPTILPDVIAGITELISQIAPQIPELLTDILDAIGQGLSDGLSNLGMEDAAAGLETVFSGLSDAVTTVSDAIGAFVGWLSSGSPAAEVLKAAIIGITAAYVAYTAAMAIGNGVMTVVSTGMRVLNAVMSANPIAIIIIAIAALVAAILYLWNNCEWFRDGVLAVWEAVKGAFTAAYEAIAGVMSSIWEVISSIWSTITTTISTFVGTIYNSITEKFNAVKSTVTSIFTGIKTVASNVWNGIKTVVSNVVGGIKDKVTNVFTTLKSTVSTVWNNIKSAITNPIQTAKDTVKSVIDKIKGFFNFEWSLPKLKMPHVSITGKFSLVPPSVPKFSIDWYKKAMNDPMILNGATIFGSAGDSLLGGGEAGAEVVAGAETLSRMMESAVYSASDNRLDLVSNQLERILDFVDEYFPQFGNSRIVLDSGALVGELAPGINTELGRIDARRRRQA